MYGVTLMIASFTVHWCVALAYVYMQMLQSLSNYYDSIYIYSAIWHEKVYFLSSIWYNIKCHYRK